MNSTILIGDCRELMLDMDGNSVDSIITDPPYGLTEPRSGGDGPPGQRWGTRTEAAKARRRGGFMGQAWDGTGVAFRPETWQEVLRVLKPGGYLLSFGGTRTFHRLAVAIEDAGFEIRDTIGLLGWAYGSGFPKSQNVSKMFDKRAGAERKVVGSYTVSGHSLTPTKEKGGTYGVGVPNSPSGEINITAPATDLAKQWDGWGTALKPAWEPIIMARKPLIGTVIENVERYGTGAINIDACRIGVAGGTTKGNPPKGESNGIYGNGINGACDILDIGKGRWPANTILGCSCDGDDHDDDCPVRLLDEQSGILKSGSINGEYKGFGTQGIFGEGGVSPRQREGSEGGASRFFLNVMLDPFDDPDFVPYRYQSKASSWERNAGLDELPKVAVGSLNMRTDSHAHANGNNTKPNLNPHPTVKPIMLMRHLVRLVTPPGGVVLDPFAGSGSTGCAVAVESNVNIAKGLPGLSFIGIDLTQEYVEIAEKRISFWQGVDPAILDEKGKPKPAKKAKTRKPKPGQATLF